MKSQQLPHTSKRINRVKNIKYLKYKIYFPTINNVINITIQNCILQEQEAIYKNFNTKARKF
jgi:hypothetical protein